MNISRPFILRPVATSLMMVAILLIGLFTYRLLPVSSLPEVDYPVIQVVTFYPGASPDVVTSAVTAPLERQLGRIPGLNQMSSKSSGGVSVITLQFDLALQLDVAEQDVQAAINAAISLLPKDLPQLPVYNKINPADSAIVSLALTSDTVPLPNIQQMAETRLIAKLSQVSGVGLVSINGGQRPAIRIQANPNTLTAYKLSLEDLRTAIRNANSNLAKGSFDGATQASFINTNDQLHSVDEFKKLIVAYRNGAAVYLSDVATVGEGAENTRLAAWADTTPALIVNVHRQPDANVIEVVDRIKKLLPQLRKSIPPAVNIAILSDRTENIRASVHDVQLELLLAIVLVVLVILLFLRHIQATLIPSIVVPLSLVGTFAAMYLLGFSINNLTLMALIVATGFVVDDAIVMIENIMRHIENGETPLQAALKGAKQISFTIISLTVSLIAVLIPLLFMGDVIGRLFREFAVTLSVAILISAVVSLTLTPMMCARILKGSLRHKKSSEFHPKNSWFERLTQVYGYILKWVLQQKVLTLTVAFSTLVLTLWLYILIPKGFFPLQDTSAIRGISLAPQSVSFSEMAKRQQALTKVILNDSAVKNLSSFIGVDASNSTLNSGQIQINLKPLSERNTSAIEVIQRLQTALSDVPGIKLYMQVEQDLTIEYQLSPTQYQLTLEDADADILRTWLPKLVDKLQQQPELTDVISNQQEGGLQAYVEINRALASRLGITQRKINETLYSAYGQRQVSSIFTLNNQRNVILEVKPEFRQNPKDLNKLYISTNIGINSTQLAKQIPLSSIAKISERKAPLIYTRNGQLPAATISFNLTPGIALGNAISVIDKVKQELAMPDSMQLKFQGSVKAFLSSLTSQILLIIAAIMTVYIVLGVLYESYVHPITILSSLPSAGVGALLALRYTGGELNVISIIGIILLIGIVMKNAIMMIDFALDAQRKQSLPPHEAIFQACLLRFRPIMMTTMAALLAALPLILNWGVGAELRYSLGITLIGGLLLSQILTLFTTPVVYLVLEQLTHKLKSAGSR